MIYNHYFGMPSKLITFCFETCYLIHNLLIIVT
jgi:hypothetical protein